MTRPRPPAAPWCAIVDAGDGYELRFGGGDADDFHERLDALKRAIPPRYRRWEPEAKRWWVDGGYAAELRRWEAEWFAAPPPPPRGGWRAPPPAGPPPDRRAQAFARLHLLPSAPPELVRSAYRTLSLLHHPDRGGDHDVMVAINRAADELLAAAEGVA